MYVNLPCLTAIIYVAVDVVFHCYRHLIPARYTIFLYSSSVERHKFGKGIELKMGANVVMVFLIVNVVWAHDETNVSYHDPCKLQFYLLNVL